jgi:flagellar hook assembly protein FlgD
VTLRILDSYGNEVRTLLDNSSMSSGAGSVNWDGRGANGEEAPSGTYFCQLRCGESETIRPVVLAR